MVSAMNSVYCEVALWKWDGFINSVMRGYIRGSGSGSGMSEVGLRGGLQ